MSSNLPVFCERCRRAKSSCDAFYEVRIVALEDPSTEIEDIPKENAQTLYQELISSTNELTAGDALNSVVQTRNFGLCRSCLDSWIESPCST